MFLLMRFIYEYERNEDGNDHHTIRDGIQRRRITAHTYVILD